MMKQPLLTLLPPITARKREPLRRSVDAGDQRELSFDRISKSRIGARIARIGPLEVHSQTYGSLNADNESRISIMRP
jgi:hypothetical protein